MEYRILGPIEAGEGGARLPLGPHKQRAVLALLVLEAGRPVSIDRLIDRLWGEHTPASAKTVVQGYVSQLRKVLEPEHTAGTPYSLLRTYVAGYSLQVDREAIDARRFERLVSEGAAALREGRFENAVRLLEDALALWRGPALADFAYEAWAKDESERLDELRLSALEQRVEANLAVGQDVGLVGELEVLVRGHPLHEAFVRQLMLALYRAGRQANALEVYQDARRALVNELGIDPSERLQELHRAILNHDPSLAAPAPGMAELPRGTVTLLFTDIEGSTRLLQELGRDRYVRALSDHRRLLREAFTRRGGVEVEMQGDSFHFAFAQARDALLAAAEGQRVLGEHEWESEPIRVRIGVHTGEPIVADNLYAGLDVHRAARMMSAGHGGQVLVSETTHALVEPDPPDGLLFRDLGLHRLKDLTAAQHLFQLGADDFPPLQSLYQTNLPVAASPLIGRDEELGELLELLRNGRGAVTLTGAGGSGKTRLALQAAAELVDHYRDGVFWVPLAGLQDAALVLPTVAQTLGAKDDLGTYLAERETLLLLDNFEHLLEAAVPLAELLAATPGVRALVTSRAPLHIEDEHEFPLDSLRAEDAMTLFLERARAAGRKLEPSAIVAEICHRLDRLPLALELAAARTKLLAPTTLLERLDNALPLLTGGRRDAPERQRTLRATIDWSYDLLDEAEQTLFHRLAVFAGGCVLQAAEEVGEADVNTLQSLVDKSLLRVEDNRFTMLETIREYALERLRETHEEEIIRRRHADWFLSLAKRAEVATSAEASVAQIQAEQKNFIVALQWADATGSERLAHRLREALAHFWSMHRRALFDAWADHYDPPAADDFPHGGYERVLDRIAERVAEYRPCQVLELGIGTANLSERLRQRIPEVGIVGIDFSPAMVAQIALPDIDLVVHDLRELPLPRETTGCDVAVAAYVLHEFDDEHKIRLLITLLHETLKPGGVCVVGDVAFRDASARDVARRSLGPRWDPYEHYLALREFVAAASRHGLSIDAELIGPHAAVLVVGQRAADATPVHNAID